MHSAAARPIVRNRVLLLLALAAWPAVFALAFVRIAPNRLVTGEGVTLAALAGGWIALPLLAVTALAVFAPPTRARHGAVAIAAGDADAAKKAAIDLLEPATTAMLAAIKSLEEQP